jgi:(p)ppGpp synthase/HD superfamily hydrolase
MTASNTPAYSPRLDAALALVAEAFRSHVRKGSGVPYLGHLMAVAASVSDHGGDEDQIIAALLHDYLEDVPGARRDDVEARFGRRVAELVIGLSDTTEHPKPPWQERKQAYLTRLAGAGHDLKLISVADKLHNATAILRDHGKVGEKVWERFSASREQTLWYYREVVVALASGWSHPLLEELERAVARMQALQSGDG